MEGSDKMASVFFTTGNVAGLAGFTSWVSQLLQEFYPTVLLQGKRKNLKGEKENNEKEKRKKKQKEKEKRKKEKKKRKKKKEKEKEKNKNCKKNEDS
jgi:hypothetical protein